MARTAKNNKTLTLEEKLSQALVPDVEQPYRLPENWGWVYLSGLLREIKNGTTIKQDKSGIGYSVTRIESLQNQTIDSDRLGTIVDSEAIKETDWYIAGDIALSHINSVEHVGKTALITEGMLPLVHGMNLLRLRFFNALIPQFFQYYSQTFQYKEQIRVRINMAVNQVSINQKQIGSIEFPLPPLAEQQRIVDRIEGLFAKLDEAKEKAQAVVDGYEDRRAAILHKAFTGELTEEWRKTNRVEQASWRQKSVDSICHSLKYGTAKKSEATGPVVVIRMGNLQQGEIDWTDLAFTTDEDDIEKYRLKPNDVLFNRTNSAALVGKTSIYRGEYPAIYAGYLIKLDYDHTVITGDYLNFALNTQDAKEYCNTVKTDGVNQSNINAKKIGAYKFPVPSKVEQEKIVEILKELLEKEKQAKEAAEQVIDQIDTMKKSILARAFCGELGTNDPADESAVELLKRVLREDQSGEPTPKSARKRTIIPKGIEAQLSTELERDIIKLFIKANDTIASMDSIMALSSKKFEILEALRTLETRRLIQKNGDGTYSLLKQE